MNFWDTLKSVGVGAASTAGAVYQSTLATFSGAANKKIDTIANKVQTQVGNITKPPTSQPQTSPNPTPPITPKKTLSLSLVGLVIAAVLLYFLVKKK